MDAQATHSGGVGVEGERSYDSARHVVGRKRHALTDTTTWSDCPRRSDYSLYKLIKMWAYMRVIRSKNGRNPRIFKRLYKIIGGRGGIRTHGGLAPTAVFKTAALNHSATLPDPCGGRRPCLRRSSGNGPGATDLRLLDRPSCLWPPAGRRQPSPRSPPLNAPRLSNAEARERPSLLSPPARPRRRRTKNPPRRGRAGEGVPRCSWVERPILSFGMPEAKAWGPVGVTRGRV